MNPLIQGHSGTTPDMSRNVFSTNQRTKEDDSESDLHPEAGIFGNHTMRYSAQKYCRDIVTGVTEQTRNRRDMVTGATDRRDMVTGVQGESLCGRDMMTGARKQIGNLHDMTGVHEEVTYCPQFILREAEKEPLHQSTAIRQWHYPCDDRGRPNFVGPPTVGK